MGDMYLSRLATQVLHESLQPKGFVAHLHRPPSTSCTVSMSHHALSACVIQAQTSSRGAKDVVS